LLTRSANGMELTPGGARLLTIAAQMVSLGAEAESAVRSARGAADRLRLVAPSPLVEFVTGPLADTFTARSGGSIEVSAGVSATAEMSALVAQRLADVALGPDLSGGPGLVSDPIFRARLVVLAAADSRPPGPPGQWPWLVDPSGTDPGSDVSRMLRGLGVPECGSRSSQPGPRRGRPRARAGMAPAIAPPRGAPAAAARAPGRRRAGHTVGSVLARDDAGSRSA
jgi:DNA-binding transcriptional LysR family regulator